MPHHRFNGLKIHCVSSLRYIKGKTSNKPALCQHSGFNELLMQIEQVKKNAQTSKLQEITLLKQKLQREINQVKQQTEMDLRALITEKQQLESTFKHQSRQYFSNVQAQA